MNKLFRTEDRDEPAFAGDPGALDAFFGHLHGGATRRRGSLRAAASGEALSALIEAYRTRGHLRARLDPLGLAPAPKLPELDPQRYGISSGAEEVVARLEATYCGSIGWDIGHIHDWPRRQWLIEQAEAVREPLDHAVRIGILSQLLCAEAFEKGLTTRIPAGKLFGLGGAESFNVLLECILREAAAAGVGEVVVGGMHRGRFNMLANVMGKPLGPLVAEILGKPAVPDGLGLSSDVSYHLGYSGERTIAGRTLKLSVSPHPSHLQLAPVISQGRTRAKQARAGIAKVMPLLLHTDASFAGQGLVAEMLQLSGLAPFRIGGTIHVVINNQIGFTTNPEEGRTARFPTDIGKLIEAPILHVNADDPEAVAHVASVAAAYRARFAADILIDLVCYRRPGHNELDEPRFTQPALYRAIDARTPVAALYRGGLEEAGIDCAEADKAATALLDDMRQAFEAAQAYHVNGVDAFAGAWSGMRAGTVADMLAFTATGVGKDTLRGLGEAITTPPAGFDTDPKVSRFLAERRHTIETGRGIGWATAEALALATLLHEGTPVRLGGQDTVRGTFTQRHLALFDQTTGARHDVLAPVAEAAGVRAEIHNTPLIENAVLCFEYGISLADPDRLVVWEAQFGEFLNVAQAVFDQCIACGEDRWLRASGLVILLPHGLDGGGPDHSTGRPERLLAACAGANLEVMNISTPANFFHALRRQMRRPFRKPLVVLTPKALLRNKACVSALHDMTTETGFRPVLGDGHPGGAQRVILCSGKVYYELASARAALGLDAQIALLTLEQLHPFPAEELARAVRAHPAADIVWVEEEPDNMGYFRHLEPLLQMVTGRPVRRAGRPGVATPATGVKYWHEAEVRAYMHQAFS
ncbi:MAG: 2-oxoglutarate dehydrogenase E1 component [Hyphomicrobiaceae bacterium]|nr:2-oxoglutarate dehydrogenase E1 component [Hyphomicrobiaceae bacterium]